ncbi:hypothetical protein ASC65_02830 [Brevundimonas sp. Root1279]|nr:hypothetical protein ASC65_02830 [Brevundimonas sp. Root1279]
MVCAMACFAAGGAWAQSQRSMVGELVLVGGHPEWRSGCSRPGRARSDWEKRRHDADVAAYSDCVNRRARAAEQTIATGRAREISG